MKKTVLEIYALLVCLISILFIIVNLHEVLFGAVKLINPEMAVSEYEQKQYMSNKGYTEKWNEKKLKSYTEEQITDMRKGDYNSLLGVKRNTEKTKLVRSALYLIIASAFFAWHWRLAGKERIKN
ncbi:hypothetical protein M0R36_05025 [bacterium]|jgi:hypothetical protein|nr:hypothetical protein [bacterium]